jgi:leader peptidase (prepilin peptidase)/N-methyltransferase
LIELLTGLAFVGLFHLDVIQNIHGFDVLRAQQARITAQLFPAWQAWVVFGHHAVLVCFLIVAAFCDLDYREIPLAVTVPGTILGLIQATLWPWPWPNALGLALGPGGNGQGWWWGPIVELPSGLYAWPFWAPLPPGFAPGGNWQTGLVTGLAGALAGTLMLRVVRFLFTLGLGLEALGLGDADLMMMAGAFLGWQPVVVAFLIGVFVGLLFGVAQLVFHGDNMLPFGPALAIGTVITFLCWPSLGPPAQFSFFAGPILLATVGLSSVLMFVASYVLRLIRY